jgi:NAD(P)-dependent dehydrogenase (short-subunit alcohol dehydrogenase family)
VVNYAHDEGAAREVAAQIVAAGGRAVPIRADVANEAEVVALFAQAEVALGPLYGLVNNVGISGGFARVAELRAENLARVLAVNVAGPFLCAREAVRRLSTALGGRGGAIVNISSLAGRRGGAGEWVHYAASKGAINTFTVGLAAEVAGEGIRVNAVAPGLIETGFHAASGAPDRLARIAPSIPMGRAGTPDEVAEVVLWLLSPAASYVTGAIIDTGGGR